MAAFSLLRNIWWVCLLLATTVEIKNVRSEDYPHFLQCDKRWGQDLMGEKDCSVKTCPGSRRSRDTVCNQGCAMTCVSMALRGRGFEVDGQPADPGTLNAWLVNHSGYSCEKDDCNNLVLWQVEQVNGNISFAGEIPTSAMTLDGLVLAVKNEVVLIAHVRNGSHFVLITDYLDKGNFAVLDPFYNTTVYNFASMSDIIVYGMF